MVDSNTPLTLNALILFIAKQVSEDFLATGRPTDGARLANAIRQQFPGFSYAQFKLTKLAEVIAMAEKQGLVQRNKQVQHMELIPGPSSEVAIATPAPAHSDGRAGAFVRPEVWRAIVLLPQEGVHYYDKRSGRVVVAPRGENDNDEAARCREDRNRVRLDPIPSETQLAWVRAYFEGSTDFPADLLEQERWWSGFAQWLRGQDRSVIEGWNQSRASKVREHLEAWANRSDVPLEGLFLPRRLNIRHAGPRADEEEQTRRAILAAINEMSLDELRNLSLPLRHILKHFRSR